jgi:thioredoxin 1
MSKPVTVTDATFEHEVLHHDGVTVVDFWAAWCAPCRMLSPLIDELAEEYGGRVRVAKLDVDANQDTAMEYGVMSIPTVLVVRDGVVTRRLVGYHPKRTLADAVEAALAA